MNTTSPTQKNQVGGVRATRHNRARSKATPSKPTRKTQEVRVSANSDETRSGRSAAFFMGSLLAVLILLIAVVMYVIMTGPLTTPSL